MSRCRNSGSFHIYKIMNAAIASSADAFSPGHGAFARASINFRWSKWNARSSEMPRPGIFAPDCQTGHDDDHIMNRNRWHFAGEMIYGDVAMMLLLQMADYFSICIFYIYKLYAFSLPFDFRQEISADVWNVFFCFHVNKNTHSRPQW